MGWRDLSYAKACPEEDKPSDEMGLRYASLGKRGAMGPPEGNHNDFPPRRLAESAAVPVRACTLTRRSQTVLRLTTRRCIALESVSRRQTVLLAIALVLDANLVSLPNQIIGVAKIDSWLSYILAMLGIILPVWLISKVLARFPGQDLFSIMISRFPVMGRMVSALFVLFFFILLVRDIRVLTEFVNITLLPSTPLVMISLLVVVTIVLTTRAGIQVIARMTEIWLPMFTIFLLLVPFLLFSEFEVRNLFPMLYNGLIPPIQGSWYAVAYIGEVMILPFLFASGAFRFREGFLGLAIGTGILLLVNTYLILSLGTNLSSKMLFPLYETLRLIRITDFLDRFDLPYILVYMPLMITKVSLLFYAVAHGLKRMIPALSIREFLVPLGVWSFVSSFWFFQNSVQLFMMNRTWSVLAILCEIALPCLFYLVLRTRKKDPSPT
jgi:spore germination protein